MADKPGVTSQVKEIYISGDLPFQTRRNRRFSVRFQGSSGRLCS